MDNIYVIQMINFDYGGYESVRVSQSTYFEFFATKEDAEEKIQSLESIGVNPNISETKYFVQTLFKHNNGPRVYIA